MKLLLHCCCAPCSLSCVISLRNEGIEPELLWYNPNIHPYTEYSSRRACLEEFAANEKLKLEMLGEYGLRPFLSAVFPETSETQRVSIQRVAERCKICYRMRLEKTASIAAQSGYSAFTTSLLISPYQDHDAIRRVGEEASAKYGVDFLYRDFRPLFREGQSNARALGFYMQKYCGCIFSEEERYLKMRNERSSSQIPHSSFLTPHSLFDRLALITGDEGLEKLARTSVLVFGAGGVGSWAAEALVRSGIGKIGIIDSDTVCASNVNRQIEATTLTLGLPKVEALKKRLLEINPACEITAHDELFCRENAHIFGIENADYVIDAIDTLNHKLDLIQTVCNAGVTLFSSMGMALKMDPSRIRIAPIWKTEGCPLARLVRQGLKERGFSSTFTVVYSSERLPRAGLPPARGEKPVNGSVVTVTASAGFFLASLVLRDITGL